MSQCAYFLHRPEHDRTNKVTESAMCPVSSSLCCLPEEDLGPEICYSKVWVLKFVTDNVECFIFSQLEEKDWYDVAIVGAGPGGATCAYFLGKYHRIPKNPTLKSSVTIPKFE